MDRPLGPEVVRIGHLSKQFVVRKDNSLKERIVGFGRVGRRHREEFQALHDVSLAIRAGETVGLIGHNGSGKSTLLKLIGGILDPSDGTVERRGRLAALIELGAGFHPDLTGRENVYLNAALLGMTRNEVDERFQAILDFAEIGDFIDAQVKFYSSGMFVRLAFAVAVHTDPDILLVDEVLAVGDEAFQRKCMERIGDLRDAGVTIVLVTHSLNVVQEMCDRAVLLHHGEVIYDGSPRDGVKLFRERLHQGAGPVDGTRHIKDVAAFGDGMSPGEAVAAGKDLVLQVALTAMSDIEDWTCSILVVDVQGRTIFGTSTFEAQGGEWQRATPDEVTVTFRMRKPALVDGRYFVNVSIQLREPQWAHLEDVVEAAIFDITSEELVRGLVRIDTSATVRPS